MGFQENIAIEALEASGRCCCICHKFCGRKIELHHIKQKANGGEDTFDNCIPLCFDCHADMGKTDHMHPKGKQYLEQELRGHRDKWYLKIKDAPCSPINISNYESDKKLFHNICSVFSSDIKYWLLDADIGGSHPYNVFDPFNELIHISNDPFNEFLDVQMEKFRGNLLGAIKKFMLYKSVNTFVREIAGNNLCVTRQWMTNHEDWIPQNMSYEKYSLLYESQANELNDLATAVWNNYCEFSRQGRRLLEI